MHGNTAALVNVVLDRCRAGGLSTSFVSLAGKVILPCTGCEFCSTEHRCVLEDDWDEVIGMILDAQVLVIGGPVYFYEVCGHLKNFIDRTYSLYHGKQLVGRHGAAIAVHAEKGGDRAIETLEAFLNTHQFSSVGSVVGRGFKPGEVLNDRQAVAGAEKLGDAIVHLLRPEDRSSFNGDDAREYSPMIETEVPLKGGKGKGIVIPAGPVNLVAVIAARGMVGCGAFDVDALQHFGYPAAKVKPSNGPSIQTLDDLFAGTIKSVNPAAANLGVREGQTGREALDLLSAV